MRRLYLQEAHHGCLPTLFGVVRGGKEVTKKHWSIILASPVVIVLVPLRILEVLLDGIAWWAKVILE